MGGVVSGLVGGLFGGGGQSQPTQPNVQVYQPTGTGNVDTQLQNLLTQSYNTVSGGANPYSVYSPQFAQVYNSLYNNPYASGYQTTANTAGNAYGAAGTQQGAVGNQLLSSILAGLPQAQTVANIGLDPQQQLYGQQLQQAQDQANVANAQYGLTGQQAAGNLNQATQNFNTNWENQQLSRAIAGLGALGGYQQQAGGAATQGTNVGTAGASNILTGGATPYTTSTGIAGTQGNALDAYIQSLLGPSASTQPAIADLAAYLNQGVGASSAGASQALADYQAQQQAQAGLFGGLGNIASWLGAPSGNSTTTNFDPFGNSASSTVSAVSNLANIASLFGM